MIFLFDSIECISENTNGTKGQLTPGFNLWTMDQLLNLAGGTSLKDVRTNGASMHHCCPIDHEVVLVTVNFDCDFDGSKPCVPSFTFDR